MHLLLLPLLFLPSPTLSLSWHPLPSIPLSPRQEHSTIHHPPDNILLIGGITSGPQSTVPTLQSFSLATQKWTSLPSLPLPLNHPNAASLGRKLFVLGGLAQTNASWSATPSAWVMDTAPGRGRRWRPIASVPGDGVGSAAVGVWGERVVLAGGLEEIQLVAPYAQRTVARVAIYDGGRGRWVEVPEAAREMPDRRDHACGVVVGRKFYVLGGREKGQLGGKGSVLVLDLGDLEKGWKVAGGVMPTPRAGLGCGRVGDKIYTFGGEGNLEVESGVFNETEVYDVKADKWVSVGCDVDGGLSGC